MNFTVSLCNLSLKHIHTYIYTIRIRSDYRTAYRQLPFISVDAHIVFDIVIVLMSAHNSTHTNNLYLSIELLNGTERVDSNYNGF